MPSLVDLLDTGLLGIWPKRADQRRLLDLGERKAWSERERRAALVNAANWIAEQLSLPSTLPSRSPALPDALEWARSGGAVSAAVSPELGVALWATSLAPALGVSGKRLANSCSKGLRSDLPAHRWLRLVHRIQSGHDATTAWAYHERSRGPLAMELSRLAHPDQLDAGDALLLRSLLSLWQRRRPTDRVRGNRARAEARRLTPKPVAQLAGSLAGPGQLTHLCRLGETLPSAKARILVLFGIEAALTDAHLSPHPTHRGAASTLSGEALLTTAEAVLHTASLTEQDRLVIAFRIQRMRAWRDQAPLPTTTFAAKRSAYIRASIALSDVRFKGTPERFSPATPGLLMLLPQLRRHHLLEPQ